jgi:translation elongation factor P/translation initiation factor 5A
VAEKPPVAPQETVAEKKETVTPPPVEKPKEVEEEIKVQEEIKEEKAQFSLEILPFSLIEFDDVGGNEILTILTNALTWDISPIPSWCSTQKSEESLIISCMPNTGEMAREANFTVTAGNVSETVSIKQKEKANFSISSKTVEFENAGGTKTISVNTNIPFWDILENPDWCFLQKSDNTITLTCSPNEAHDDRTAFVDVQAGTYLEKIQIQQKAKLFLEIEPETIIEFDASGGEETLTINTNASTWSISNAPSWCTIQKSEKSLIINCSPNPSAKERETNLNITAADKSEKILITQKEKTAFSISPKTIDFDIPGGTKTITVNTNVPNWDILEVPAWCSVQKNDNTITLNCLPNETFSEKKGVVEVKAGTYLEKVRIQQKAKIFLEIEPRTAIEFNVSGGSETLTVNTNASLWNVSNTASWCTVQKSGNSLVINCTPNPITQEREVDLTVTVGNLSETVSITQKGKTAFSISPKTVEFDSPGGTKTIAVNTNIPTWDIVEDPSWCPLQKGENSIILKCSPNETTSDRNVTVTVTAESYTEKIQILQKAMTFLEIEPQRIVEFDASGGNEALAVNTNAFSWSISNVPSWCTVQKSGKLIHLSCTPNTSTNARETEFFVNAGDKSEKVIIKQKEKISLTVSQKTVEFENAGGTKTISVSTNDPSWTTSGNSAWCSIEKSNNAITINCIPNEMHSDRKASFEVKAGNLVEVIQIQQKAMIFIELDESQIEFNASGGNRSITINTNASSWSVSKEPAWCSLRKQANVISLSCNSNPSTDERKESFQIIAENQSKEVKLTQKGITFLEKGGWKQAINKVMYNGTVNYEDGLFRGERSEKGVRNGLGVYNFISDNESYWGEFLRGESNGKGIYIIGKEGDYYFLGCRECKYYVGNWENDKKNGLGKCYDKTGKLIYFGFFFNERPTETYPQKYDNALKFECIEYDDGNVYLGETNNKVKHGLGIYFWSNGNAWYGEWVDDDRNGFGIEFQFNGAIIKGKWVGNKYVEN